MNETQDNNTAQNHDFSGGDTASKPLNYSQKRQRPKAWLLALIGLLHIGAIYGLAHLFAPDMMAEVERDVLSSLSVTITTPDPPEPPPEVENVPDEGAAGAPGKQATPKPVTAPKPVIAVRQDTPMPPVSSRGDRNVSGAKPSGDGTGAAGTGMGTGSGRGGSGQGGIAATRPSVRSGSIDAVRDFPIPDGGRATRFGTRVVVAFTVGVDGRASDCSVLRAGPDPETNRRLCPLVVERIRFNPARDVNGNPVPARFGWEQVFSARR